MYELPEMEYLGGILLENKFCHCVSLQFWNMDTIGIIERPVWSRLLYDCTDYFEMGIFFFIDLQKDLVNNTDEKNLINNWYSFLSKRKQLIQLDYLISSTLSPFHYVQLPTQKQDFTIYPCESSTVDVNFLHLVNF